MSANACAGVGPAVAFKAACAIVARSVVTAAGDGIVGIVSVIERTPPATSLPLTTTPVTSD
jgi:hypothetical protein